MTPGAAIQYFDVLLSETVIIQMTTISVATLEKKEDLSHVPTGVHNISPNKRYLRWNDVISTSGDKLHFSYRGFDTKNGMEVAWHSINLTALEDDYEQSHVAKCVNITKRIENPYVVQYLAEWFQPEDQTINFITTYLEPLKEFIGKVITLRWRIVKKWAIQILKGLDFLHSSSPQIIHRNLTCSHIYINGGTSHISIGELWMAAIKSDEEVEVMGLTKAMQNAFTAPDNLLSTKIDIYSFGMCVLEMITREEPYKECNGSFAKIRRRAAASKLPNSLSRVIHPNARSFIEACLLPQSERPSASELLEHPFLEQVPEDDLEVVIGNKMLLIDLLIVFN